MSLSELTVRKAHPGEKPYKLYDEKGLYLIVTPKGQKWWRLRYRFEGKSKTIGLGVYPEVSLREARLRRDEARTMIARGIDPARKKKKGERPEKKSILLSELADEWFENMKRSWRESYARSIHYRVRCYILPEFGNRDIREIQTSQIYDLVKRVEKMGKVETAHRLKQIVDMMYRYALTRNLCSSNPAAGIGRKMIAPSRPVHYPAILDPEKVGALMRAIDGYEGIIVRCALKLLALTFVRPGELRHAEWTEINEKEALWEIPAEKMKMKEPHLVPLSRQALQLVRGLRGITGSYRYLFPGRDFKRPISDNTLNSALRRMGYSTTTDITAHGFRAMARTLLHEKLNFPPEVIERQLAHRNQDPYGGAYNRAQFMDKRREMMQAWADYLDELKEK
jgi:integrase